jgi:hypothetical protein
MKLYVNVDPPIPVKQVVTGITIELSPEEGQLLAASNWCGPKTVAPQYFSDSLGAGSIAHGDPDPAQGTRLRDLLRSIGYAIQAGMKEVK